MNQIAIETEIPVSVGNLTHLLGRCAYPETVFDLLEDDPRDAERIVHGNAKEFIRKAEANVAIKSIEFAYVDCKNVKHAVAYFAAVLSGEPGELIKVVGDGKFFLRIDR